MANKRRLLEDEEHIVRHIPKNRLRWDGETDQLVGILPQAFELRELEEYLSWWSPEAFGNGPGCIALCIANAREKRRIGKRDAFVMVACGHFKALCLEHAVAVRTTHEPKQRDYAYATVRDYTNIAALLESIAAALFAGLILNSQVSASVKPDGQ